MCMHAHFPHFLCAHACTHMQTQQKSFQSLCLERMHYTKSLQTTLLPLHISIKRPYKWSQEYYMFTMHVRISAFQDQIEREKKFLALIQTFVFSVPNFKYFLITDFALCIRVLFHKEQVSHFPNWRWVFYPLFSHKSTSSLIWVLNIYTYDILTLSCF
jgi:hypothetical protein